MQDPRQRQGPQRSYGRRSNPRARPPRNRGNPRCRPKQPVLCPLAALAGPGPSGGRGEGLSGPHFAFLGLPALAESGTGPANARLNDHVGSMLETSTATVLCELSGSSLAHLAFECTQTVNVEPHASSVKESRGATSRAAIRRAERALGMRRVGSPDLIPVCVILLTVGGVTLALLAPGIR